MLAGSMKESIEHTVSITGISTQAFKSFLEYFYTMKINLTPENASEMIVIANDYNVPRLLQLCEKFYVDFVEVFILKLSEFQGM